MPTEGLEEIRGGMGMQCASTAPYQTTKKRAVELLQFGMQVYDFMNKLGIKKEEYCHFGNAMQTLLQLPD